MGKCKIISNDGGGLYTVDLLPDFTYVDAQIVKLQLQLDEIDNVELINLEAEYLAAKSDADAAQVAVNVAIAVYASSPTSTNLKIIEEKTALLGEAVNAEAVAKTPYDAVKGRKLGIQKRITRLEAAITDPAPLQAWCADLSDGVDSPPEYLPDDLAGTIEILGEDANGINLQPQFQGDGLHQMTRDGLSTPAASFTPASYYYNRAMLPPWQKWQTLYRPGTIQSGGVNGFTILLDDVRSGEQTPLIPVNNLDGSLLTAIHAEYMNCGDAAFTDNDHVIIRTTYDDQRNRVDVIIGFVDNPKSCTFDGFIYHPFVIGGGAPGFHGWQNVRDDLSGVWEMNQPMYTPIVLDGPSNRIEDWKTTALDTGGDLLVQWEVLGSYIYVNGLKVAVLPNFTKPVASGDPFGVPVSFNGFIAAWVTTDRRYVWAVSNMSSKGTRYLLRKTINVDLTGNEYDITTDPDGWEVSAAFGPPSYDDFTSFSIPIVNASGTEMRSMDAWIHGVKRTPQLDPGINSVWLTAINYDDTWPEESQINIGDPSASTINTAGVSIAFNGFIGDYIQRTTNSDAFGQLFGQFGSIYENGNYHSESIVTFTGKYAVRVGYEGDIPGYVHITGVGTNTSITDTTNTIQGDAHEVTTQVSSADGYGTIYEFDFESFIYPRDLNINTNISQTFDKSAGQTKCEGAFNQSNYHTHDVGFLRLNNVRDKVYQLNQSRFIAAIETNFSDSVGCGVAGGCIALRTGNSSSDEFGFVLLNADEHVYERNVNFNTENSVICSGDPTSATYAPLTTTYGDDPFDWLVSNPTTSSINETARVVTVENRFTNLYTAKDFSGNYIMSVEHTYDDDLNTLFDDFLTGGDLATLDELDNGDGTGYRFTHVII